jgi:L-ribulose-5-phosphate 3-epimerase
MRLGCSMNRRDFLLSGALAVAASTLDSLGVESISAPKKRALKKAVNLGMIKGGKDLSLPDRFLMARDAGFTGIELNLPDDALSVEGIQKAMAASGMELAGIICTPHWKFPLSDPDPAKREQTVRGLQLALRQGGELGCSRVLLVPGVVSEAVDYGQCWSRSIEGIRRCVETAELAKCHIAIENVWNQFILNPVEAVRYVDEINSPWVGWHFDIGNCVVNSWPEHWPRILGKRLRNLHIKEFSRKKAKEEGLWKGFGVELGEGDVNWAAVMKSVDEAGYEGYAIAEVPGGDASRLKFLAERMDTLLAS